MNAIWLSLLILSYFHQISGQNSSCKLVTYSIYFILSWFKNKLYNRRTMLAWCTVVSFVRIDRTTFFIWQSICSCSQFSRTSSTWSSYLI